MAQGYPLKRATLPPGAGRTADGVTLSGSDLSRVIQVGEDIRSIAYYDDRRLYVAQNHAADTNVFAFEGYLRKQGLFDKKIPVSMAELADLRDKGKNKAFFTSGANDNEQSLARARDLIERAITLRTSDIHFEIHTKSHCTVLYRIDGYLREIMELPAEVAIAMVRAIYNIAEGVNKPEWRETEISFARISEPTIIPSTISALRFASTRAAFGAKVVMRVLPKQVLAGGNVESLGLSNRHAAELKEMLLETSGLILMTGPTGAGKSTLLKYSLEWLFENDPNKSTITVEDPVEYPIKGATQIDLLIQDNDDPSVDQRSKAWVTVIATTLRLDPDRLMVSEIRDGGAAVAAIRAAQTGHITLSTLHTNDGWGSLDRLIDLMREGGVVNPMSQLANSKTFLGATAQRLVPTLCQSCSVKLNGNENRIGGKQSKLYCDLVTACGGPAPFAKYSDGIRLIGDGCNECVPEFKDQPEAQRGVANRGILGRTLVVEIVRTHQRHLDIAMTEGVPAARRSWMSEGGKLMIDHALEKVVMGIISPEVVQKFVGPLYTSWMEIQDYERYRAQRVSGNVERFPPRTSSGVGP